MRRDADRIALIEAAYAPAETSEAWLAGLVEAARSALGGIVGAYGFRYDGFMADVRSPDHVISAGVPRATLDAIIQFRAANPEMRDLSSFRVPPVESGTEMVMRGCRAMGMDPAAGVAMLRGAGAPLGIADMVGINALAPSGGGCYLALLTASPVRLAPRLRRSLVRIAAHAVAGLRLRRWEERAVTDAADAVLDARGGVVHAGGEAREPGARRALTSAVASIRRAQGGLRRTSPEEAVELWRALVAGRWSIVDHVDTDGKRFLLARRNPPQISDPHALSEPERQVAALASIGHANKLIAYELGIAESTVSSHIRAALTKLRLASRAELVRLLNPLGQEGGKA